MKYVYFICFPKRKVGEYTYKLGFLSRIFIEIYFACQNIAVTRLRMVVSAMSEASADCRVNMKMKGLPFGRLPCMKKWSCCLLPVHSQEALYFRERARCPPLSGYSDMLSLSIPHAAMSECPALRFDRPPTYNTPAQRGLYALLDSSLPPLPGAVCCLLLGWPFQRCRHRVESLAFGLASLRRPANATRGRSLVDRHAAE